MAVNINCGHSDHASNSGYPGWTDVVGTVPDGQTPPTDIICAGCAAADKENLVADPEPEYLVDEYTANKLTKRTLYVDAALTTKRSERVFTYSNGALMQETLTLYDRRGESIKTKTWNYITVTLPNNMRQIKKMMQ